MLHGVCHLHCSFYRDVDEISFIVSICILKGGKLLRTAIFFMGQTAARRHPQFNGRGIEITHKSHTIKSTGFVFQSIPSNPDIIKEKVE